MRPTARRPIILQHLLLGMNAHINLDLGVCASELAEPGAIDAIRVDFDAVNDVLADSSTAARTRSARCRRGSGSSIASGVPETRR